MHELSLCGAIVDVVTTHAGGRSVRQVNVKVGYLRQVVPDTLQFCWNATVAGTDLADTLLDVDYIPATIRCGSCSAVTTLHEPVLRCGTCAAADVELVTGEEFLVESIDLVASGQGVERHS